jgi:hypothetical protein
MVLRGGKLLAATSLGDSMVLDLEPFHLEYCALMRNVWRDVPVVWEAGLPVRREPPAEHTCRASQPPPAAR